MRFSSTALHSWGTPGDPAKSRISNTATTEAACQNVDGVWENGQCRVFPYAQKVADARRDRQPGLHRRLRSRTSTRNN